MSGRFLVTGGAGFVGSHLVATLIAGGDDCVVLDNFRIGHRAAILPGAEAVDIDLADRVAVDRIVAAGPWDAVFHFAGLSLVAESMRDPFRYLGENFGHGLALVEACVRHGVDRFVLSSTAALFGRPTTPRLDETTPIDPVSPYGESKWLLERALVWADRVHGLRSATLRYFNAAGSDPAGRLGEDHRPETHLMPLAIDTALGRRPEFVVFGGDYDTPDGTCIRDYVHVSDLADAHLRAFRQLDRGSVAYNVGIGAGASVLDVIRSVERVSGRKVRYRVADRRPGDPAVLVADPGKIMRETGWSPRFTALDDIVRTAFDWRAAHPNGYESALTKAASPV